MNLLITSASRKVALVRAFQRAVAAVGGGRVFAVDLSPYAPALYEADAGRLVVPSDDPGFIDEILELCLTERIELVVPTRDEELPVFASARERFAQHGILVLVPDADTVAVCQDKSAFAEACARAGFATPRVVPSPTDDDLPLFLRPRTGKGGAGARAVRHATELSAALAELGAAAFAQALIVAPEFTVDVFVDPRDGTPISCVPRERILVVAGESHVGQTVRDELLSESTIALATALGLTGHVTVQAFRRGEEVLFIEVNPRYGGAAALGFAAGAPTAEFAVQVAAGKPVEPLLGRYEAGLIMLRYAEDRFLQPGQLEGASS
jgi:carbamoyl-phosphate synthase large subunit